VKITDVVVAALMKRKPEGGAIHIEEIQDQVELALMRGGEHEVARAYVLYRERRSQERAHEKAQKRGKPESTTITGRRARRVEAARPRAAERPRQGILRGPSEVEPSASSRRRSRISTTAWRWRKCASASFSPRAR
jgi:ribonucleotide reductase alpha subunit